MPQYLFLIYGSPEGGPRADEMADHMQQWVAYSESLRDAGIVIDDHQLQGVETATTIRVRDGETLITDGPFAATHEVLGGYYLVECPDLDTALAHAARAPVVHYGSVEVRPIVGGDASSPADALAEAGA